MVQRLFRIIWLTLFSCLILSSITFSQTRSLPTGLNKNPTFEEIVDWLNKNSFPKATIGMETIGSYNYESDDIPNNSTTYSEEAVFAAGFKLDNGGTCQRLDLVNENISLIQFATQYPDPDRGSLPDFRKTDKNQKVFSGELRIPLEELSYKDGKKSKQIKSKDNPALWYSSYNYKTDFLASFKLYGSIFDKDKMIEKIKDQMENGMQVRVNGSNTDGRDESFYGSKITFRFEDKTASQNFDSAFRQLIKVCSGK